jgi:5-methylcytosine-specific restriction endonuclease McrA
MDQPLCLDCLDMQPPVLTPAVDLDHTININTQEGYDRRFDIDLLKPLCKSCHSKHTTEEQQQRRDEERKISTLKRMNDLNSF